MNTEQLLHSFPDPLVIIDDGGAVLQVNLAATRRFGGESSPLVIGESILPLFEIAELNQRAYMIGRELGLSIHHPLDGLLARPRLLGRDEWPWTCRCSLNRRERYSIQCTAIQPTGATPFAAPHSDDFTFDEDAPPPSASAFMEVDGFLLTFRPHVDRHNTTDMLQRDEGRFRILANGAPIGMFQTDRDGRCTYTNPMWQKIAGIGLAASLGDGWSNGIHPDDRATVFAAWNAATAAGETFKMEFRMVTPAGDIRWVRARAAAICHTDGSVVGYVGTNEDVSERVAAEQLRTQLLDELEHKNRDLADFAYTASHDLKTPLRGIASLSTWLLQDYADKLDATGRENLELIRSRVTRMTLLVDGILRYSKLGRAEHATRPVHLLTLITDVVDLLEPPDHIEFHISENLPDTLQADPASLQQILLNLVENAIKYMDKDQGHIQIGCTAELDDWHFWVQDNGPGIEQRYFDRIFRLFQHLNRDSASQTGLGLAMVKKAVEISGGRVWLESEVGLGSTFHFTLPQEPGTSSGSHRRMPPPSAHQGAGI